APRCSSHPPVASAIPAITDGASNARLIFIRPPNPTDPIRPTQRIVLVLTPAERQCFWEPRTEQIHDLGVHRLGAPRPVDPHHSRLSLSQQAVCPGHLRVELRPRLLDPVGVPPFARPA